MEKLTLTSVYRIFVLIGTPLTSVQGAPWEHRNRPQTALIHGVGRYWQFESPLLAQRCSEAPTCSCGRPTLLIYTPVKENPYIYIFNISCIAAPLGLYRDHKKAFPFKVYSSTSKHHSLFPRATWTFLVTWSLSASILLWWAKS